MSKVGMEVTRVVGKFDMFVENSDNNLFKVVVRLDMNEVNESDLKTFKVIIDKGMNVKLDPSGNNRFEFSEESEDVEVAINKCFDTLQNIFNKVESKNKEAVKFIETKKFISKIW